MEGDYVKELEQYLRIFASAVNGKVPLIDEPIDLDKLYRFTGSHSISATVAPVLLKSDIKLDRSQWLKWKEIFYKNYRRTLLYDDERKMIFSAFEDNQISFIPLKAVVLNRLYPVYGSREFADNDILVGSDVLDKLEPIMSAFGYEFIPVSITVHYIFHKEPMYNFEIHHRLFPDRKEFRLFNEYFQKRFDNLRHSSECELSFGNEDNYIYLLAHAYKHNLESGTGLRTLSDIYLYRKKIKTDKEYLDRTLKELEIYEFAKELENLSEKLFATDAPFSFSSLTEEELALLKKISGSGTFGTAEAFIRNKYKRYSGEKKSFRRIHYFKKRLFPDIGLYKKKHPVLYRHKLLHPWFYIYRPIYSVFSDSKSIKNEIKVVSKMKKEKE